MSSGSYPSQPSSLSLDPGQGSSDCLVQSFSVGGTQYEFALQNDNQKCKTCHHIKRKCKEGPSGEGCERCTKLRLRCEWRDIQPKHFPPSFSQRQSGSGSGADGGSTTKSKTFQCPLPPCGRMFKRMEHLKRHMLTHTMQRPFACPQCNKKFSRSDNLNQHLRTHGRGTGHHGPVGVGAMATSGRAVGDWINDSGCETDGNTSGDSPDTDADERGGGVGREGELGSRGDGAGGGENDYNDGGQAMFSGPGMHIDFHSGLGSSTPPHSRDSLPPDLDDCLVQSFRGDRTPDSQITINVETKRDNNDAPTHISCNPQPQYNPTPQDCQEYEQGPSNERGTPLGSLEAIKPRRVRKDMFVE